MLYQTLKSKINNLESQWKLFHVNSRLIKFFKRKNSSHDKNNHLFNLDYSAFPKISLSSESINSNYLLNSAIKDRKTQYNLSPVSLDNIDISKLLLNSYFLRDNSNLLRSIPSAGGKHTSEIFFHYSHVKSHEKSFKNGLYYYDVKDGALRYLLNKDCSEQISHLIVQDDLIQKTMLQFFITSVFPRSTSKYGDRGYRFSLIEAGHLAQNINLIATSMGMSCINVGGFYENDVNNFLEIDGINHSVVYIILIGQPS
jgi:SagB-type dehydrogenase family enzyme